MTTMQVIGIIFRAHVMLVPGPLAGKALMALQESAHISFQGCLPL